MASTVTQIALLRAINVGGNNRLPMTDLVALLKGLGCREVVTYINSGNAVYQVPAKKADRLAGALAEAIARELGLEVPVVTRSAGELAKVAKRHPFEQKAKEPKRLNVGFLAELPAPEAIARLDPNRSPPDEFQVVGREVYLHYASGVAGTKLTNQYFDSKLGTVMTVRNWNTVLKLVELCG